MDSDDSLEKYYDGNYIPYEYTETGRIVVRPSDNIEYRYEIISELGRGAFSNVYKSFDHKENDFVALKVIKNNNRFHKAALKEINIYHKINSCDDKCKNIINLNRYFKFNSDIYFDFEIGGISLYKYYKDKNPINVKTFSSQILNGLVFIHNLNIIHADLKPENIIVENNILKIIDFGSSFEERKKGNYYNYIQSRWYRSPEVLFNNLITRKIDVWSFGCIMYELYYRKPLFPAKTTSQLYNMFDEVFDFENNKKSQIGKLYNKFFKKIKIIEIEGNKNLTEVINLCITFNSKNRISSVELFKNSYFLN
jgi:dual specificity tyrosine-phosphorylation-regulated kinase 2/3/4